MRNFCKSFVKKAAVILAAAMLAGCAQGSTSESSDISGLQQDSVPPVEVTPPFWVVEDKATGGTLYLLGSMHAGERGVQYPDYVLEAYESSENVAVELDTIAATQDMERLTQATACLLLTGTTAKDVFGEHYDETVSFMTEKGVFNPVLDYYVPYFWASTLTTAMLADTNLSADYGTESLFLEKAHEDGKNIIELESIEFQYQMMADIPMDYQVFTVTTTIGEENYKVQVDETVNLYNAWKSFDDSYFSEMNSISTEGIPEELIDDHMEYMNAMYTDRQKIMGEKALELLRSGDDTFLFVGTAHFYVDEDIIDILEAEGYTVTPVLPDSIEEAA